MCITGSEYLARLATEQMLWIGLVIIIPNLLGAVTSFLYYVRGYCNKICSGMIYAASIWGIFRIIYSSYQLIVNASQYFTMNSTINMVLKIAVYGLIVCQTYTLGVKRKEAVEVNVIEDNKRTGKDT